MKVGYLGVGNMGQPMAAKLLDGGHDLIVYDISEAAMEPLLLRQARRAASPKDLGDQCEILRTAREITHLRIAIVRATHATRTCHSGVVLASCIDRPHSARLSAGVSM